MAAFPAYGRWSNDDPAPTQCGLAGAAGGRDDGKFSTGTGFCSALSSGPALGAQPEFAGLVSTAAFAPDQRRLPVPEHGWRFVFWPDLIKESP